MIIEKDLQDYYQRSGDNYLVEGHTQISTEHGFCVWDYNDTHLVLIHVYGDGQYWDTWAETKAKELNLDKILFATRRNPEGFCRKYKYKVIGHILEREI